MYLRVSPVCFLDDLIGTGSPSVGAKSTALQMFMRTQSFCLRVSGAVAPSASFPRNDLFRGALANASTIPKVDSRGKEELCRLFKLCDLSFKCPISALLVAIAAFCESTISCRSPI